LQGAAVVAREDHPGDKRLVAYVVAEGSEGSKNGDEQAEQNLISELRTWLKSKLPDYMVPALFVRLGALPLTPNGKVDRKALPPPEPVRPTLKGSFVGPRNSTEEMLAQIWSEVLSLDKVGIHDNFFELGGHSLMVIQVLSRLRETVQVELSMSDFFERPTIVTMAELVEATLVEEIGELSEEEAESLASSAG
jgi:acyl carrier protein